MLRQEDESGTHVIAQEVRDQFSAADGSLIKVTNITTHTLGVVLWDDDKVENACSR